MAGDVTPQQQSFLFAPADLPPPRRNLVIEAGAGTGKTTAIVAEVLRLLLDNEELAPERIVLVTFTEKAAGEIADRIHAALAELESALAPRSSSAAPPEDSRNVVWPANSPHPPFEVPPPRREDYRRACTRQLARIDSLRSQTIHSFCQSLLRQFPIEAGLDPQFKIVEGFERSLLYGQLYDAWLDAETRTAPTDDTLRDWELLLAHTGYLFMVRELIFMLVDRRDLLTDTTCELGEFDESAYRFALDVIRSFGDEAPGRLGVLVRETPMPRSGSLDEWIAYFEPLANEIRTSKLPRGKKFDALAEAMKVLRAGDIGDSIYDRLVSHRAALSLLAMTRRFLAFLDAEKRKLGVVDFDDLLLRTAALLDDPNVVERVRRQYDYIFVDEFQDTDRTQARIIDRLARDASGAYVPGKTVVVGDPKQSIYGFRRADPETYHRMTEEMIDGGAEHRILGDQYRSDPPLLEAVNEMFASLFPEGLHDPNVFRPPYRALRAGRAESRREAESRMRFLKAAEDEGEAIAAWIARSRDGGERDLQRFAILFRRTTNLDDYLDTLERHGIDYVLPPTRLFLDRRAPVDLVAVLRAIAYPFDKGAEISAARTPYFALTDEEIVSGVLSGAATASVEGSSAAEAAAAPPSNAWNAFHEAMERYREAARHRTVAALIDLVVATTGIESVYAAAADGQRSLRHLEHVRAIAFEYDRKAGGSVRQFVDEIARRRNDPDEMEPSLVDEAKNAVRILTVHAAKGLEFETVILPDLVWPIRAPELFVVEEPRSLVMTGQVQTLSAQKLKSIATEREKAEMKRLFYVAVTRAMSEVVFVCNPAAKNMGFFSCLTEVFGPRLPEMFEDGSVAGAAAAPPRRRLRDESAVDGELAACEIAEPAGAGKLTPADAAKERAREKNRASGILMHRVLERWDGTSSPDALLAKLAAEIAAPAEAVKRVRARLATVERSPMLARIARAETVGRELPVRFLDQHGEVVERRIDRLIRENGREIVIDYKSGAPDEARLLRDREQVARYCAAVAAITGWECEGVLWYVDLENDAVVEC